MKWFFARSPVAVRTLARLRHDDCPTFWDQAPYEMPESRSKHIRAGAAKVVEIVAEKRPESVASHLDALFAALSAPEPQTRWMLIRVMGFCAHLNPQVAKNAIAWAAKYLDAKEGLCMASSADLFLGDVGALSQKDAQTVFPILEHSMETVITNEQDWLLESLIRVFANLGKAEQEKVLRFAERWQHSSRKSTQQRARKIMKFR